MFSFLGTYKRRIIWGLFIALFLALVTLGYLYRKEIQHAARLALQVEIFEQAQQENLAAIEQLERDRDRLQGILLERERKQKALRRELDKTRQRIAELEETDEDVRDWLDTAVPDALLDELHQNGGQDEGGQGDAPGEPSGAVPGAAADRQDEPQST